MAGNKALKAVVATYDRAGATEKSRQTAALEIAQRTEVEPAAQLPAQQISDPVAGVVARAGTEIAGVMSMLERKQGATIDELMMATGWLPHTTRAARTGLRKQDAGSVSRVSAPQLEGAVCDALRAAIPTERRSPQVAIKAGIERIVVGKSALSIRWRDEANLDATAIDLSIPWSPAPTRRQREILQGDGHRASDLRPMRTEARRAFASAYGKARDWFDRLANDPAPSVQDNAAREHRTERSIRQTLSLAFLDPALVTAALEGRLPRGFGLSRMMDLPPSWPEQWNVLGLDAPARR